MDGEKEEEKNSFSPTLCRLFGGSLSSSGVERASVSVCRIWNESGHFPTQACVSVFPTFTRLFFTIQLFVVIVRVSCAALTLPHARKTLE